MKKILLFLSIGIVLLYSCEKEKQDPGITTTTATPLSASTCKAKATINNRGSYAITDFGFVCTYGSTNNSTYISEQNKISLGKTISVDTFSAIIPLTGAYYSSGDYKWYVRAYITNEKGTVYGNAMSFDPLVLSLQSISPTSGKVGDIVTINGNNFDPIISNNVVKFYNNSYYYEAQVVEASKTKLKVIVPAFTMNSYYSTCDIVLTAGGKNYTLDNVFTLLPTVTGYSPKSGTFGTYLTINGSNLNQISGIMFDDINISSNSNTSTSINVYVPSSLTLKKFKVYIVKGGVKTEVPGGEFTMNKPEPVSFSPSSVSVGRSITITGSNFNSSYSYNSVFFGLTKVNASYTSYSSTSILAYVPSNLAVGDYNISVCNGVDTVAVPGTLSVIVPTLTSISPTSGAVSTSVIITGDGFGTSTSNVYVYFGSTNASITAINNTQINVTVPSYIAKGSWIVSVSLNGTTITKTLTFTVI